MTTKKKKPGTNSESGPIKQPIKVSALQKALNVINSYRANIHKSKKADHDKQNKKGFNDSDDALFFKNLHNMWIEPYTENSVLCKKNFDFGVGCLVFKDGQKYTVKKENGRLIIAN